MDQFVSEWMKKQKQPFREYEQLAMNRPLQTILTVLNLLQDENVTCTPEECAEYLELIRKCSLQMYRFIRNVDDAALPPCMQPERRVQDIAQLLHSIVRQAQPAVERAGCTLILEEDAVMTQVAVSREEMERILGNMISNAVNASRYGGVVTLFLHGCDDGVQIGVRDCGTGMTQEKLAEVLEGSNSVGCAGLDGCRRLLREMNSKLQGESEPGKGSCFWFELPACSMLSGLAAPGFENLQHRKGISILELELSAIIERQEETENEALL